MALEKNKNSPGALFAWVGGKGGFADRIIPLFPHHHCYVEVFAGAGSILFRKPESRLEIINDINLELVTLYRVIKLHLDEFIRYLRWLLTARSEFDRFQATDPRTQTDIQRAVRFYYLQKNAFAPGRVPVAFRNDGVGRPRFNLMRLEEDLSAMHIRLADVFVENLPYQALIERFDKPTTLFYLDPPYHGREALYGKGVFSRDDYAQLAEQLGHIEGRFVMSINNAAEIRALFKRFLIRTVAVRYSSGAAKQKPVRELLIMNFEPGARR